MHNCHFWAANVHKKAIAASGLTDPGVVGFGQLQTLILPKDHFITRIFGVKIEE